MTTAASALAFHAYPVSYNAPFTVSVTNVLSGLFGETAQDQSNVARTPALFGVHDSLDALAALPQGWDGHGSAEPHSDSIANARQLIEASYAALRAAPNTGWRNPHVSASESGEVAFEWWNGSNKLTAYVSPAAMTYIKSWGSDTINDMDDGDLSARRLVELWTWLYP